MDLPAFYSTGRNDMPVAGVEFYMHHLCGDDVVLDGAAAPGTSVYPHMIRRKFLPVEPAPGYDIIIFGNHKQLICGIGSVDFDLTARLQIFF